MAITGTKLFASGDVLTANDTNQYLMRGVKVYASAAVRDAAYGGAGEPTLEEGEMCYLADTNEVLVYDGSAWIAAGGGYGVATGGSSSTITVGGDSYTLLTFTTDGTLTVTKDGKFDVLLVGGGAGAGGYATNDYANLATAGGGGGGLVQTSIYLAAGTYAVDIGAGGNSGAIDGLGGAGGQSGNLSSIASNIFAGGGYSMMSVRAAAQIVGTGGSLAGNQAGPILPVATFRTPLFGANLGGTQNANTNAGGGGGSAGAGGNGTSTTGGAGGNGTDISTFIGGSTYYAGAGGGGGGSGTGGTAGNGGVAGTTSGAGNNAVNVGAGGGGTYTNSKAAGTGGNGAAGVVYVRFK